MDQRHRVLWLDGIGALVVGVVVLGASKWLSGWYGLPRMLVVGMGVVNLLYGSYSLPLAMRTHRPIKRIVVLAVANMVWGVVCVVLVVLHRETVTTFGIVLLVAEGLYVGGLGWVEWRWRGVLRTD